jgi:uncharacterized protein with PQ loop repeat
MNKRILIALVAVFITWSIIDFVIHGVLLQSAYEATANLWRPMEEMKIGLMYLVTLLFALFFVLIYALLISEKSLATGIKYGLLFGLAAGISMGYGSYTVMPIPYSMAFTWFLGTLVEAVVAGAITGAIVKE